MEGMSVSHSPLFVDVIKALSMRNWILETEINNRDINICFQFEDKGGQAYYGSYKIAK